MNDPDNHDCTEPAAARYSDREARRQLTAALQERDLSRFSYILEKYPQCRVGSFGSEPLLEFAGHHGMLSFVKILVQSGADINHGIDDIGSPVAFAAANGHLETVRWMVENGAIINHSKSGVLECLALNYAAMEGNFDMVKLLVELGAQIQDKDVNEGARRSALFSDDEELIKYIEQFSE